MLYYRLGSYSAPQKHAIRATSPDLRVHRDKFSKPRHEPRSKERGIRGLNVVR